MIEVTLTFTEQQAAKAFYMDPTGDVCAKLEHERTLNTFLANLAEVLEWCADHPDEYPERKVVEVVRTLAARTP